MLWLHPQLCGRTLYKKLLLVLKATWLNKNDKCLYLTLTELATVYTLFVQDNRLANQQRYKRFVSRAANGSVRFEIGFALAQKTEIEVIVLSQTFGILSFDPFKNLL